MKALTTVHSTTQYSRTIRGSLHTEATETQTTKICSARSQSYDICIAISISSTMQIRTHRHHNTRVQRLAYSPTTKTMSRTRADDEQSPTREQTCRRIDIAHSNWVSPRRYTVEHSCMGVELVSHNINSTTT